MSDQISDEVKENILAAITEETRLRTLSNKELVSEYLSLGDADDELHTNEMCTRLWPEWSEVDV